jgi:hypothetical protein
MHGDTRVQQVRQLAQRRAIRTSIATMTDANRGDLEATHARASDQEHERGPYRDDLEAAHARVSNLEREAEALRKRNAELERPAPTPEPTAFVKAMTSGTRWTLISALVALAPSRFSTSHETPHPVVASIFFGIALVCWCCSGFRNPWAKR